MLNQSAATPDAGPAAPHRSAYVEQHRADWIPVHYDEEIYHPGSYDDFIWSLQRPWLRRIVQRQRRRSQRLRLLDFACGTGRIIAMLEPFATEAVGIDTSPQMVERAKQKVQTASIRCEDILSDAATPEQTYDVITAFRFFLNTEDEMRQRIMPELARRLADDRSLLIFNIHGNTYSAFGLKALYRHLHGWGGWRTMSYRQTRQLVEEAGLEIAEWYGFGLFPLRLYRSRLAPAVRGLDRIALRLPLLRWISHDLVFVCRRTGGASSAQG